MKTQTNFVVNLLRTNDIGIALGDFQSPKVQKAQGKTYVLMNRTLTTQGKEKEATQWTLEALSRRTKGKYVLTSSPVDSAILKSHHLWTNPQLIYTKPIMVINRITHELAYYKVALHHLTEFLPRPSWQDTEWIKNCQTAQSLEYNTIHHRANKAYHKGKYNESMSYPVYLMLLGLTDTEIDKVMDLTE